MTKSQKNIMQILGKEKTMLFVHGYGCDKTCGDLLPAFETSYKIVLIDLVGSGNLI
jgi:pimeloyl-ACP methyl ester carboxylesterase